MSPEMPSSRSSMRLSLLPHQHAAPSYTSSTPNESLLGTYGVMKSYQLTFIGRILLPGSCNDRSLIVSSDRWGHQYWSDDWSWQRSFEVGFSSLELNGCADPFQSWSKVLRFENHGTWLIVLACVHFNRVYRCRWVDLSGSFCPRGGGFLPPRDTYRRRTCRPMY